MKAQVALTVSEGKRLIARAIAALPEVRQALAGGRILLKGGSTVSAVAEELCGRSLRLSGRISPRGAVSALRKGAGAHSLLLDRGIPRTADDCLEDAVLAMDADDVCVTGANLIGSCGGAAMLAGAPLGGPPGRIFAGLMAQGCKIIIAAGLEKLGPGSIADAVRAAGRCASPSMGMSVGLMPIHGRLITEVEALELLSGARCTVIARGGIAGAEGSVVLALAGEPAAVGRGWGAALAVKGLGLSGDPDSLDECNGAAPGCSLHASCLYRGRRDSQ